MTDMKSREAEAGRSLMPGRFYYHTTKRDAKKDMEYIKEQLATYGIGRMGHTFLIREKDIACLFHFLTEEEYDRQREDAEEWDWVIAYRVDDLSDEKLREHCDLPIFQPLFDSESCITEISDNYDPQRKVVLNLLSKRMVFRFGRFEDEPLEWIELYPTFDPEHVLLLSKYCFPVKDIKDWSVSDLAEGVVKIHKYLNEVFLNNCFTAEEKARLLKRDGKRVFIPKTTEIIKYFHTQYLRLLEPCLNDFGRAGIMKNGSVDHCVEYFLLGEDLRLEALMTNGSVCRFSADEMGTILIRPLICLSSHDPLFEEFNNK